MLKAAFAICLALFVFAPIAAQAQDGNACAPVVLVQPDSVTVKEGDVFNASVVIENLAVNHGMCGIQFVLTWNKTVLNSLGMTEVLYHTITPQDEWDNIWQIRCTVNNTGGYAEYACSWLNMRRAVAGGYCPANGISGNHTLAIIMMKAVGAGSTTLHFSSVKVADKNAAPLLNIDENAQQPPDNGSSGNASLPQQTRIDNSSVVTAVLPALPMIVPARATGDSGITIEDPPWFPGRVQPYSEVYVTLNVSAIQGLDTVILSYTTNRTDTWQNITMTPMPGYVIPNGYTYEAQLPAQPPFTLVTFAIIANDTLGNCAVKNDTTLCFIEYIPEFPVPSFILVTILAMTVVVVLTYAFRRNRLPKSSAR